MYRCRSVALRGAWNSVPRRPHPRALHRAPMSSMEDAEYEDRGQELLQHLSRWTLDHPRAARQLERALEKTEPELVLGALSVVAGGSEEPEQPGRRKWKLPRSWSPEDIAARAERRAENGQGKTCFFAYLSERDKVKVLKLAAENGQNVPNFSAKCSSGKTAFFAKLPEDLKLKSLREWAAARDAANTPASCPPTSEQLGLVFVRVALPMVAFGFMDNFFMISFGGQIESHLGIALGLSTMAAAGLGNLCSDVVGLGIADQVEHSVDKMGIRDPHLSIKQRKLWTVRIISTLAAVLGISVGCLAGMCPLYIWPDTYEEKCGHCDSSERDPDTATVTV